MGNFRGTLQRSKKVTKNTGTLSGKGRPSSWMAFQIEIAYLTYGQIIAATIKTNL